MPNRNYIKGRRKEYKVCNELRKEGYEIVQRTAGSHSPIDIFAINSKDRKIVFIQVKPDNITEKEKDTIYKNVNNIEGLYYIKFLIL